MMDPSSVQHGGVEHVLHQHGDLDPHHLLSLPSVHSHHVLAQQVPLGGYMHPAHSLPMPPPVHIVPNPISQVSLTGSPYVHPGLMQEQTEKYGPLLFHKDDQGLYTCFFTGCGKKLKANFSRHVAKHEMDGDKMDPNLATQIQTSSASKNLGTTKICSHPTHQEWWGTSAEQPVTEFYKRCSKCKKCYIRLQQESKRQRLSLEGLNNSPMAPPVMMQPQYGGDMFPMGHVNTLPMLDHHLKRDDIDDEQGPSKRMRIEESASLMASLQELTYKHFKEMAELTARHSAHSRKLIAENTAVRMAAELRHTKDKEDLEVKFKNQWDQFRFKCLREREDLYQAQLGALNRELNGATIPVRPCRLCTKRIYSTFLYQCNLCNEEACIRCQAVMVCGVCGTKSCENCTIKHNWLIWCNRCHKTFCSNHRSISDDICPNCDAQKDMMMHPQHLTQHLSHDLDHSQHLHHYDHDPLPLHHHSSHHHSEELMGQHMKFEDLDNPHHPHSHSHELSNQHYDPHLHHDHHHLQHEHMQHLHEHLQHEHMQHHLHGGHDDHHYQDQQYDLQHLPPHDHIPSDLSEHHHHHHQQQYEQNYQDQQDYHHEQSIHHEQQSEQELEHQQQQHEQSHNYEQQNYQEQQDQASPSQNGVDGQGAQGQESEQQNEEQGNQATSHNDGEESEQYLQQGEQDQQMIDEQDQQQTSPDSQENKYDDLPPQSSQTIHKASLIR